MRSLVFETFFAENVIAGLHNCYVDGESTTEPALEERFEDAAPLAHDNQDFSYPRLVPFQLGLGLIDLVEIVLSTDIAQLILHGVVLAVQQVDLLELLFGLLLGHLQLFVELLHLVDLFLQPILGRTVVLLLFFKLSLLALGLLLHLFDSALLVF